MTNPVVTDIAPRHYGEILNINRDNVEMLSPLNEAELAALLDMAALRKAVMVDGKTAAFLIALREGTGYQSVNYRWFSERLGRFLYIDRIAVHEAYRGMALGTRLYREALDCARRSGVGTLAAEINIEPENRPSLLFHQKLGFAEIGRQVISGGQKTVSMQTRAV